MHHQQRGPAAGVFAVTEHPLIHGVQPGALQPSAQLVLQLVQILGGLVARRGDLDRVRRRRFPLVRRRLDALFGPPLLGAFLAARLLKLTQTQAAAAHLRHHRELAHDRAAAQLAPVILRAVLALERARGRRAGEEGGGRRVAAKRRTRSSRLHRDVLRVDAQTAGRVARGERLLLRRRLGRERRVVRVLCAVLGRHDMEWVFGGRAGPARSTVRARARASRLRTGTRAAHRGEGARVSVGGRVRLRVCCERVVVNKTTKV